MNAADLRRARALVARLERELEAVREIGLRVSVRSALTAAIREAKADVDYCERLLAEARS